MNWQTTDCRCQIAGRGWRLAAVLVAGLVVVPRAEVIDRVMAVVAGDLVLMSDVQAARELALAALPSISEPSGEVLAGLIDRALVLAEVERFAPPEPDQPAVDRELAAVRARFSSAEAFAEALTRSGMEERHLRERLRQDLRIAAYVNQRFTTVPPSEEELGRYYRDHPMEFTRNGIQEPFETVRPAIVQAVIARARRAVVEEWLVGLRRRADIRVVGE